MNEERLICKFCPCYIDQLRMKRGAITCGNNCVKKRMNKNSQNSKDRKKQKRAPFDTKKCKYCPRFIDPTKATASICGESQCIAFRKGSYYLKGQPKQKIEAYLVYLEGEMETIEVGYKNPDEEQHTFFVFNTQVRRPEYTVRIKNACIEVAEKIMCDELTLLKEYGPCFSVYDDQVGLEIGLETLKKKRNFNDLGFLCDSHMTMIHNAGMAVLAEIIVELKEILKSK